MIFFTLILSLVLGHVAPNPALESNGVSTDVPSSKKSTEAVEQLAWSPDRRLSWGDFKADPDSSNTHHAMTAANLAVDAKCSDDTFKFKVRCVFLPTQSWSKNKISAKLLKHEQMHFDLTEVHARLLRKELETLGNSCSVAQSQLNETVSAAFASWKAEQRQFDKLSNHGLNAAVSQEWAATIDLKLKQLEAYK